MKRKLFGFIFIAAIFSLVACGGTADSDSENTDECLDNPTLTSCQTVPDDNLEPDLSDDL